MGGREEKVRGEGRESEREEAGREQLFPGKKVGVSFFSSKKKKSVERKKKRERKNEKKINSLTSGVGLVLFPVPVCVFEAA